MRLARLISTIKKKPAVKHFYVEPSMFDGKSLYKIYQCDKTAINRFLVLALGGGAGYLLYSAHFADSDDTEEEATGNYFFGGLCLLGFLLQSFKMRKTVGLASLRLSLCPWTDKPRRR